MTHPIRLGIVGLGKIARDQHLPAIAADPRFRLMAVADPKAALDSVPSYSSLTEMLAAQPDLDAISFCTPPAGRHAIALEAILAGKHVMLEKPPAATVTAAEHLIAVAAMQRVTLFTTWHSREAAAVEQARAWLAEATITAVRVDWREDIRRWHPGQNWILEAGGFGVFDPGINGLSILTRILPRPIVLDAAHFVVPQARHAPIAAALTMQSCGVPIRARFDFRNEGDECWTITVETAEGCLALTEGGARLSIDRTRISVDTANREYARLYDRFAMLIACRESDVDLAPIQLVADAFLVAETVSGEAITF
ncbi:Gfo/Idh/MocA family protein [Sphingomonas sp. MMS24-J13]|uniref:Gfo/Idh/MocA family protein n=1 Tax=Sphingomonas sp. MMS24-J13 TaxID=3238686 RepID=UPI003850B06B